MAKILWKNIKGIKGLLSLIAAIILPVVLGWFVPDVNVPLRIVSVIVLFLLFSFVAIMYILSKTFYDISKKKLPALLHVRVNHTKGRTKDIQLLLGKSELFIFNSLVSINYTDEEDYEILIGIGIVDNIRESDGKVQVTVVKIINGYEAVFDTLKRNAPKIREKVAVKPNIPADYYDYIDRR